MKVFSQLIVAASLLCAAPLVQACNGKVCAKCGGAVFKQMDKNSDGAISKKEFEAFHGARFAELDANKDGKLVAEELDAAHRGMPGRADAGMELRFDEVDINRDGLLGKDEAEIGMPMLFRHFDELDTNKDGKLSKDELPDHMQAMGGAMGDNCETMKKRGKQ